ncbi:hypothetical protein AWN76_009660 [Rhodothermaceae bacterium RA]|nr:hypothetical protein AWN76_009660 [Rhodothermaceae bacterium RA]
MSETRYLVAARKYRPRLFHELVAQEHVTETLKNAIRLDRLAHAYLFSGPRGVGKTTAARILAKAINCTTPPEERADAAEPCRACDSCRSFEEGRSLNIIEIDAASNNKVEDIRDLRETVRVPPQGSRKKVYIVDEVHMLSNAAFNALLKTLEEPPPYVLFIFATTEPNKVLPTILSRCQRFDFRRIPVPDIVARLQAICATEGITADEASLLLIARKGDGALRDALSAFDQAVSLCGTHLRYDELAQALGVVGTDLFFEVTDHVAARSSAGMLALVQRIVTAGYDLQEFLAGLAEHLRNLIVARTMPDPSLIEAAEATRQRYVRVSQDFPEPDLLRLLMIVAEAEEALKSSTQPRLRLEMALLKMAALAHTADLRRALAQIDRLEQLVRDGKGAALAAPGTPSVASSPSKREAGPPAAPERSAPSTSAPSSPSNRAATPSPAPAPKAAPEPEAAASPEPEASASPEPEAAASPEPEAAASPEPEAAASPEPEASASPEPEASASPEPEASASPEPEASASPEPEASASPEPPPSGRGAPPAPASRPAGPSGPSEQPPGYLGLFGAPALRKKSGADSAGDGGAPQDRLPGAPAASADVAVAVAETGAGASPGLSPLLRFWPSYVRRVRAARIHVGALLDATRPCDLQDGTLRIAVPDVFHQRMLDNQHDYLLEHLNEMAPAALRGQSVDRLSFEVQAMATPEAGAETDEATDPSEVLRTLREEDPVVRALFEQFGGEIAW